MSKSITVTCGDSRFSVGYTGLAAAGTFETRQWLMHTLLERTPSFEVAHIAQGLQDRLTERFRTLRVGRRRVVGGEGRTLSPAGRARRAHRTHLACTAGGTLSASVRAAWRHIYHSNGGGGARRVRAPQAIGVRP